MVPGRGCKQEDGGHAGLNGSTTTVQPGGPGQTGTFGTTMVVSIPWKLRRGEHAGQSYSGKARAYHECDRYTNGAMNNAGSDFTGSPEGSGSR